jgi:hypothetical protein
MLNIAIMAATTATAGILLYPRIAKARLWRATITPLASIIGSGFLVLGPILDTSYGLYAPIVMAGLCLGAYLFGWAIRYNIAHLDAADLPRSTLENGLETAASWTLAFAYFISVAYYLNLFGAFGISLTGLQDPVYARELTTSILGVILLVGWTRGFHALERLEQISVGLKLAIIVGLLVGLTWYFADRTAAGALTVNPPTATGWNAVALAFGLIVTVQGFETSRYLGADYDAATRIRSMRLAQWLSTAIYIAYISLIAYVFPPDTFELKETAIIDMMAIVAPILPVLLVAAALSAQFSAAVADTGGSGGLIMELTGGRVSARQAYLILVLLGLMMTWTLNVFEIISYASRAFALYYALQATIAAVAAQRRRRRDPAASALPAPAFLLLAIMGMLIAVFGTPVE